MNKTLRPFHLAIPVTNIQIAHDWYVDILDCQVGRKSDSWMDFDFFGHQLVTHLVNVREDGLSTNSVDDEDVPARHFGIILQIQDWKSMVQSLKDKGNLIFPKKYSFENQALLLLKKVNAYKYTSQRLFDVKFVPLL